MNHDHKWNLRTVDLQRFSGHVARDGNCSYRAVAVGLVVATAELSAESRHSLVQQLYSGMQQRASAAASWQCL